MNNLESLSLGDVTKWEAVKAVSRGEIYAKLAFNRDKNIFEKELRKIHLRKQK